MKNRFDAAKPLLLFVIILLLASGIDAQSLSSEGNVLDSLHLKENTIRATTKKYEDLSSQMDKQMGELIKKNEKQEAKILKALKNVDSSTSALASFKASTQFTTDKLNTLRNKLNSNSLAGVNLKLDSLTSALRFLQGGKLNSTSVLKNEKGLEDLQQSAINLQTKFQQSSEISAYLNQRDKELQMLLQQYSLPGNLLNNKNAYYFQQQVNHYKEVVNSKDAIEKELLKRIQQMPAFNAFIAKNSILASFFPSATDPAALLSNVGLQNRNATQGTLNTRLGLANTTAGNLSASDVLQSSANEAEQSLSKLKNEANKIATNSSEDIVPNFKPNNQKTKSLLDRLEFGFNFQSSGKTQLIPNTSDLGISLGYKINDKSDAGIGVSYKLGWGNGLKDIRLSSQGISLRSYANIKFIHSFYISTGYELNYFSDIEKLAVDFNVKSWQPSFLAGITKRFQIKNRKTNLQLLYDFLAMRQVPAANPIKFRIGYTL